MENPVKSVERVTALDRWVDALQVAIARGDDEGVEFAISKVTKLGGDPSKIAGYQECMASRAKPKPVVNGDGPFKQGHYDDPHSRTYKPPRDEPAKPQPPVDEPTTSQAPAIIPTLGYGSEVEFAPIEEFVDGMIHPGLVPVIGVPEAGKSVFTRSLIWAMVNGASEFLGQRVLTDLRIALWDLEDPEGTLEWLGNNGLLDYVMIPRDQHGRPLIMSYQDPGAEEFIDSIITGGRANVFMLDSTKSFFGESSYTTKVATKFLRERGNLARRHNVAFMPLEHAPLNRPTEAYGGSLRLGAMHGKVVITRPYGSVDSRRVVQVGKRSVQLEIKAKISGDGLLQLNDYAELFEGYHNEEVSAVGTTLYRRKRATAKEITDQTGIYPKKVKRIMERLEEGGLVTITKAGRTNVYVATKLDEASL